MGVIEMVKQGGPVVWVIAGAGVVALLVYLERSLSLHRARIRVDDFLKGIFNILRRGNAEEALTICEETPGPVAHLVKTAIIERDQDRDVIRSRVEDAGVAEISRMERGLVVLAAVAQAAPLLGLFGTVLGMVEALMALQAQAPLIHSADVLGGALKALSTTGAGLAVAIPCYVAFNLLVAKIDGMVLDMEHTTSEITSFLAGAHPSAELEVAE